MDKNNANIHLQEKVILPLLWPLVMKPVMWSPFNGLISWYLLSFSCPSCQYPVSCLFSPKCMEAHSTWCAHYCQQGLLWLTAEMCQAGLDSYASVAIVPLALVWQVEQMVYCDLTTWNHKSRFTQMNETGLDLHLKVPEMSAMHFFPLVFSYIVIFLGRILFKSNLVGSEWQ